MLTVEKVFKQDIEQLKTNTTHLGNGLVTLEPRLDDTNPSISQLRDKCSAQEQIDALICQLDVYEYRSLQSNIRIRVLPDATAAKDIVQTLQGIFREILNFFPSEGVEIDRVYRAPTPPTGCCEPETISVSCTNSRL